MGEDQSIPYGQTLLSLIPVRRLSCGLMQTATTMNGTKRQLANRLRRIVSHQGTAAGAFCVVGNEDRIEGAKDLFKETKNLYQA